MAQFKIALLLVLILLVISPVNAYAYLDPGSGSYLIQMIIAGLLAASFAIKSFWFKIKTFFVGLFSKKNKDDGRTGSK